MSSLAPPPVAPLPARTARPPWLGPAALGLGVAAATAVLAVGDPNTTHVPLCPFHAVTGLDCPFCGSLRAVHSLAHVDVLGAASHNLLFTLAAPVLVVAWALRMAESVGRPLRWRLPRLRGATVAFWVVIAVFGVARNLPAFSWLGSGA